MAYIGYQFLENKYTKWYCSMVSAAKERNWTKASSPCYTESHHIVPRSLGGSDSSDNLVRLTAREHFIAHLLLTKMCSGEDYGKIIYSMHKMAFSESYHERDFSSRQYDTVRQLFSNYMKVHSHFSKNPGLRLGCKHSEETKQKIKTARSKQITSESTKQKMSASGKGMVWMTDLETMKTTKINQEDVDKMMALGYCRGRFGFVTDDLRSKLSKAATEQWNRQKGI